MSSEIASQIYADKAGEPFYDDLVNHMTSGTCKVLVLSDMQNGLVIGTSGLLQQNIRTA